MGVRKREGLEWPLNPVSDRQYRYNRSVARVMATWNIMDWDLIRELWGPIFPGIASSLTSGTKTTLLRRPLAS